MRDKYAGSLRVHPGTIGLDGRRPRSVEERDRDYAIMNPHTTSYDHIISLLQNGRDLGSLDSHFGRL